MNDLRIVLLGKTGDGKSSTGNTILGVETFHTENSPDSVTRRCESRGNITYGKNITVVDCPGFFDIPKEELNSEIVRCITECAPGPHAFLIVLRVGRYTEQEKEAVKKITASFGEDALRYAVVLFTHGDQLSENQSIQDFVRNNTELQELVDKCGGRVHVIDNKYWKQQQDGYRSNRVQVEDLLNTIEEMIRVNGGQCYSNEVLQMVQREIEEEIKKTGNEGSEKERIKQTKKEVHTRLSVRLVGVGTGIVVGAVLGCITALPTVLLTVPKKSLVTAIFKRIASLVDPGPVAADSDVWL